MIITTKTIANFYKEDKSALANALAMQLKSHFNSLVKSIPTLETIEWRSSQEDEMIFDLTYFKIIKDNGYTSVTEDSYNPLNISEKEFSQANIELILAFQGYLKSLSQISFNIFNGVTLSLENDLILGDGVSFRIV